METQTRLVPSNNQLGSQTDSPTLQFTENGSFKITVFSDFHLAEGTSTPYTTQP